METYRPPFLAIGTWLLVPQYTLSGDPSIVCDITPRAEARFTFGSGITLFFSVKARICSRAEGRLEGLWNCPKNESIPSAVAREVGVS